MLSGALENIFPLLIGRVRLKTIEIRFILAGTLLRCVANYCCTSCVLAALDFSSVASHTRAMSRRQASGGSHF